MMVFRLLTYSSSLTQDYDRQLEESADVVHDGKKADRNHRTWRLHNQVKIMPYTWLINFIRQLQLPQRNQLYLKLLTFLRISLKQDMRRSALQQIAFCAGLMNWLIVILII